MGTPFKYKLILPSGTVFVFEQPQWDIDFHFPDGFGLPPIVHQTQDIYQQPGASLKSIKITPRILPLTIQLKTDENRSVMHEIRKTLWKALRWNLTTSSPPDPLILRYENNNVAADLRCYFLSDNFVDNADSEMVQNVSIQLVAYDPFWYRVQGAASAAALTRAAEDLSSNLSVQGQATVSYITAKINGLWAQAINTADNAIYGLAKAPNGDIYAVGEFTSIGGVAAAYIAKWNGTAWSALGAGLDARTWAVVVAQNGLVYATGEFANAGGGAAARIAYWDGVSWHAMGSGLSSTGRALAVDSLGNIYVGGDFLTAGGVAVNRIAKWDGSVFTALGVTGVSDTVFGIVIDPANNVYAAGAFLTAAGTTVNLVAKWNGTAWSALGSGLAGGTAQVQAITIAPNGDIYVAGGFTSAGGITVSKIAKWNGTVWSAPATSGGGGAAYSLAVSPQGLLYLGGLFTSIQGLATADHLATWNGSSWSQLDIDLPGNPIVYAILCDGEDIWIGLSTTGTATFSTAVSSISMLGDYESFPVITITGAGTLQWIQNVNSNKKIILNLYINAGEIVTIDLSPGVKSIISNSRGNLIPYSSILPISDFGVWSLSPDPIAASGSNTLAILMTGVSPTEMNDNNNQLSGYSSITGVTQSNTGAGGILYVTIVSEGAGNYHVNLYSDSARTALVGHTASYNSNGAKAIVADNSSGLGGTITVDARTAADSDIYVYFATAKIVYKEPFLSADAAVLV